MKLRLKKRLMKKLIEMQKINKEDIKYPLYFLFMPS